MTSRVQTTRRSVLRTVSVAGAAVLAGAAAAPPALPSDAQFSAAYQAPQDLAALATLPSPMAGVTLDDFEAAAVAVIRRVARYGPVIVVGGSMGGATVNRVGNSVPHLVDHLVYVSAFCPSKLPTVLDCITAPEGASSKGDVLARAALGDQAELGANRIN